jgi:hypothetical protein
MSRSSSSVFTYRGMSAVTDLLEWEEEGVHHLHEQQVAPARARGGPHEGYRCLNTVRAAAMIMRV